MKARNIRYFIGVGLVDTWKAKWPLLANMSIVAGICLPILLLLGLNRGLVEQFRQDILKSPTACEIRVTALRETALLTEAREHELENLEDVDKVIPLIEKKAVTLQTADGHSLVANLYATNPGDPRLVFYKADVLEKRDRGAVLAKHVADKLGIQALPTGKDEVSRFDPPEITVILLREEDGVPQSYSVKLPVRGIITPTKRRDSKNQVSAAYRELSVYLSRWVMDRITDFSLGRPVGKEGEQLYLPGSQASPEPEYEGYLAFCEASYGPDDLDRLDYWGFTVTLIEDAELQQWRTLYGLLQPQGLSVYWIHWTHRSEDSLTYRAKEIEDRTTTDDIVLPWCKPQALALNGEPHQVVGVSLRARWLKQYFRNSVTRFSSSAEEMQVKLALPSRPVTAEPEPPSPGDQEVAKVDSDMQPPADVTKKEEQPAKDPEQKPETPLEAAVDKPKTSDQQPIVTEPQVTLTLPSGEMAVLDVEWIPTDSAGESSSKPSGLPVAVVPAGLVARFGPAKAGHLIWDGSQNRYIRAVEPNAYKDARIYARNLRRVPDLHEYLERTFGYDARSERDQVEEMLGYESRLNLLFRVIFISVLVVGVGTVLAVFWDVTARKRYAIGVMRVMGMPAWGVVLIVLVRAGFVGLLGGAGALGLAWLISQILTRCSEASCLMDWWWDVPLTIVVALVLSLAGVLVPALRAATISPLIAVRGERH